jgi:hypothetical protein
MLAINRILPLCITFLFFGCDSSNITNPEVIEEEVLPKVNRSNYRAVDLADISLMCYKKLSADQVSGDQIFVASFLPLEYHLEVKAVPLSRFRREESFPEKKQDQLEWFASHHASRLDNHMISSETISVERCMVDGKHCVKQTMKGKEFGFPFEKTYFLRYYRYKTQFYAVTCWTLTKNASVFKSIAQYMGMTLKEKK